MRQVSQGVSLHAQGDVFQLKYLAEQAELLMDGIDDLIAATERAAPVRTRQPYVLKRTVGGSPINEEARWERAIWSEWHDADEEFVPGVCSGIVSYQVMLRDRNADKGWGEIDLLGRSPEGWPVVIELKGASSNEPPLRGLVEGVAYSIALRKAWTECLASQWCNALGIADVADCDFRTIFVAPTEYWNRVTGQTGPKWSVPKDGWQVIARLLRGLGERRLPVSLARLDAADAIAPRGIRASLVEIDSLL